jgi:hypothetical protein
MIVIGESLFLKLINRFQPSYRRDAPIGGMPLLKRLLDLFIPLANIYSKSDLNAMAIGEFCNIIPLLTKNENGIFRFMGKT